MKHKIFNVELCKRFVSDKNLPIPVVETEEELMYYLKLYEKEYGAYTEWNNLCDEIAVTCGGNTQKFLDMYYKMRDDMIMDILNCPEYEKFNNFDLKEFAVTNMRLKTIQKGDVFNAENVGKWFMSIDLRSANFQALKYFDKNIVKGEDTYGEYISHYTSSEYAQTSKYTRQVVFGKCNPSRQIAIQKYLIQKIYENVCEIEQDGCELVRFCNDELVFEMGRFSEINEEDRNHEIKMLNDVVSIVKERCGVDVSVSFYKLEAACLHSEKKNKDRDLYYVEVFPNNNVKFKKVPLTYYSIFYKLYNNIPLSKEDYFFRYEGLDAYIDDAFTMKRFSTAKEAIEKENERRKISNE